MKVFTSKIELHLFYPPFYSVKFKYKIGENKEYQSQNANIFY
jgi:hypothetical protein